MANHMTGQRKTTRWSLASCSFLAGLIYLESSAFCCDVVTLTDLLPSAMQGSEPHFIAARTDGSAIFEYNMTYWAITVGNKISPAPLPPGVDPKRINPVFLSDGTADFQTYTNGGGSSDWFHFDGTGFSKVTLPPIFATNANFAAYRLKAAAEDGTLLVEFNNLPLPTAKAVMGLLLLRGSTATVLEQVTYSTGFGSLDVNISKDGRSIIYAVSDDGWGNTGRIHLWLDGADVQIGTWSNLSLVAGSYGPPNILKLGISAHRGLVAGTTTLSNLGHSTAIYSFGIDGSKQTLLDDYRTGMVALHGSEVGNVAFHVAFFNPKVGGLVDGIYELKGDTLKRIISPKDPIEGNIVKALESFGLSDDGRLMLIATDMGSPSKSHLMRCL